MSVETHEFQEDGMDFKDDNLTILPVFLYPEHQKNIDSSSSTQNLETGAKRTRDLSLEEIESDSTLKYKKEILSLMFNQSQRYDDSKSSNKKRSKIDEDAALNIPDELQNNQTAMNLSSGKSSPSQENKNLHDRRRELFPERLPKSQPSFTSIAYICKGPDYKGKFDPLAAQALGLTPGPQYGKTF
jgi:ribonuclease Z